MDEIMELWEELKFEVGTIGNDLLPKDKKDVLVGMGDRKAPILFIGNDPNLYLAEDYKVEANSSGEFLLKLLDIVEILPSMYYITTLSKREVKFKYFLEEEKLKLIDLLYMQIALIEPQFIVFLGKDVAQSILGKTIDFDKERGNFFDWKGNIKVLITYDIESVIKARTDEGKKSIVATNFWTDIKAIKTRIDANE
ncbi:MULTISPECIES: uracil-DNA glycosylase family protein [Fusobacterium]|uniref:uracil-DNA glycosylase family protein n=1 Tax=Fusobacterium TaxID=848 RepID=UPI0025B88B5D|nr:uracil-DNA glycosylase family protein [Fusobacterium sp.]MCI7224220.1 uracil-DNA glycosylase family protein [Fusobacterium sp.]MDD7410545.1 uracil-DNA glycosylase family protein [Fusobacteriaceae bacterium]MDY5713274.1 uracil-DNA glycosylase family protein [Fusobacterium gastrosuis]